MATKLQRLLFLQGNRCFFCKATLLEAEASVEHLIASANGGKGGEDNCVVCCKSVNAALGHLSIKAKLQAVLNQRGGFACPAAAGYAGQPLASDSPDATTRARAAAVVADLLKRGPARPRRVSTLKNTMNALFKMSLSDLELDALLASLEARGYVAVQDTKVSYALPPSGA